MFLTYFFLFSIGNILRNLHHMSTEIKRIWNLKENKELMIKMWHLKPFDLQMEWSKYSERSNSLVHIPSTILQEKDER